MKVIRINTFLYTRTLLFIFSPTTVETPDSSRWSIESNYNKESSSGGDDDDGGNAMAERTRVAERTSVHFDDAREKHDPFRAMNDVDVNPPPPPPSPSMAGRGGSTGDGTALPADMRDGLARANQFVTPLWLSRKLPLEWTDADACRKDVARPGRHCCLFAPIACCTGSTDIINGFCTFHLRAIFNLTYVTDPLYTLNANGQAVIWFRTSCFVLDPRPVDDRMTSVFPLFELFVRGDLIKPNEIKLHNLERYLKSINATNWDKIYSLHVNFLYRLITVHSSLAQPQRPSREEELIDNQLMLHWNAWNEYYSWILRQNPAEIYIFYNDETDFMGIIPVSKCTTLTQMIVRLFTESYTRLNDKGFNTGSATYGIYISGHLAYSDNLCSYGTTMTENVTTIGAMATLPMLRNDPCKTTLIQYDKGVRTCQDSFCITSKINSNSKGLNRSVLVSSGGGGDRVGLAAASDATDNNATAPVA